MPLPPPGRRSPPRRFNIADHAAELFAGILLFAFLVALGMQFLLPADALAPAVTTVLFVTGAATAGYAWLSRRMSGQRALWFDIAGALTLVGVAISCSIESDQLVRLLVFSDQPE